MTTPWSLWLPDWTHVNTHPLDLLVGWETSAHNVQVRSLPISDAVAQDLQAPVQATMAKLVQRDAVAYTPDLELGDDQYAVVDRAQLDTTGSMLTAAELTTPADVVKTDFGRPLLFYAFAVGPPTARLVFLRRTNPRAHLTKKYHGAFTDELARVDSPLFSFDLDRTDLVLVAGHGIAALDLKAFARLFRDSPELIARTPAKVAELAAQVKLTPDARAALEAAAQSNGRIRTRLLAALGAGHLTTVKAATLRASMIRFGLDPALHLKPGGVLDFDASTAMSIMQLLNEDLTIGALSGTSFVINKKSPR